MLAEEEIEGTLTAEEVTTSLTDSCDFPEEYLAPYDAYDISVHEENVPDCTADEYNADTDFQDQYNEDEPDEDPELEALSGNVESNDIFYATMTTLNLTDPVTDSLLPENEEPYEIDIDSDMTKSSCSQNEECTAISGLTKQFPGSIDDAGTFSADDIIVEVYETDDHDISEGIILPDIPDIPYAGDDLPEDDCADISKAADTPPVSESESEVPAAELKQNYGALQTLRKTNNNPLVQLIIQNGTSDIESTITEPALTPDSSEENLVSASPWKTYYNAATDFGANGNDSKADEQQLRQALLTAGLAAQSLQQMVEVFVPKGTYHLKDTLFIFSDTWLHLADGAVMYRDDQSKVMLLGVYLDSNGNVVHSENYKVGGYNQIRNVKISGGEWHGGAKASDAYAKKCSEMDLVFRHGENITIEDTTIGNDTAVHSVNFDGCRNLTISNVKFVNHYKYEGPDSTYFMGISRTSDTAYAYKEALHTDYLSATDTGSNAKPIENLGMSNILIANCTFSNVVAGLGTHHIYNGLYADGYKIQNCTFRDVPYICINARNFRDFVCKENTASNVGCFLQGYNLGIKKNSVCYIIDNTISGKKFSGVSPYPAIEIRDKSIVLVMNNTFSKVQADGVRLYVNGQSDRTASAVMQAEVMQNRFYDGIGIGGGASDYAAVRATQGVKLTTWQNMMYLNGASSSSKIYGIYLYGCSDGCKLSTDYISGATTGIYVSTLHNLTLKQSEIIKARENGVFASNINGLSLYGVKILSGLKNGLYICKSTNVTNSKSLSLWNSGTDLILYNLTNAGAVSSFATFIAGSYLSSGIKLPCIGYKEGDINFDGRLTSHDVNLLVSYVHSNSTLTPAELYIADMNKDKVVDWKDISLLRSKIAS